MNRLPNQSELTAFVDGELDLARQLEIESLAHDEPHLRAEIEALRGLRGAIRRDAAYHAAPLSLRRGVAAALAAEAGVRVTPAPSMRRPWFTWPSFVAGIACAVFVVGVGPWLWPTAAGGRRIENEVLASHNRAVISQRLVDVASSDHHTVKPWLSQRLDFSPPVDPPPATELLGARVDAIDGRPVAALVMRHAGHLVDAFVWPASGADSAVTFDAQRGFQIAHWSADGLQHWVVSDLDRREFDALVRALRATH